MQVWPIFLGRNGNDWKSKDHALHAQAFGPLISHRAGRAASCPTLLHGQGAADGSTCLSSTNPKGQWGNGGFPSLQQACGTLQGDVCLYLSISQQQLYDEPAYNRYVSLSKGSKVHDTARKRCNIKQDVLSLYCSTSSILKFMLRAT